jgi:hypothetical protein
VDNNNLYSEDEDDLLLENPLPRLGSVKYLDQTAVDLGAPYSELDLEFVCEDNPLESKFIQVEVQKNKVQSQKQIHQTEKS